MKAKAFVFILFLIVLLAPAAVRAQAFRDRTTGQMRYSSVCVRNKAKIAKTMDDFMINPAGGSHTVWQLSLENQERLDTMVRILQPCAEKDEGARDAIESLTKDSDYRKHVCDESRGKYCWPLRAADMRPEEYQDCVNYMALFRREVAKALSDPNYSAELGSVKGDASPTAFNAAPAAAPAPDDPSCPGDNLDQANSELAKIDDDLASYDGQVTENSTAVTPSLQAVMWGTSKQAEVIRKYCRNENFVARLAKLEAAYESALKACRQINSAPDTACVPALPNMADFESRMAAIPVPGTISSGSNTPSNASNTSATGGGSHESTASSSGGEMTGGATSGSSLQSANAKKQKEHGPQNASACIVVKNSRLTNTCDYDVEVSFCVENPQQTKSFFDNSKAFECPNGGLSTVPAGKVEPNVLHGDLQWFACSEVDIATMRTQYSKGSGYGGSCY